MPKAIRHEPRILVTNDDGIQAPGLKVLERIARTLSKDVWVVAPEVEQSGAGHSLSINVPLRLRQIAAKRFAVFGTPTDSVLAAVRVVLPKGAKPFDLVLSGVNRGANLGEDITHSGTVAAAMEGALCGIPSFAFSQGFDFTNPKPKLRWETAQRFAPTLIRQLLKAPWDANTLYNINFPDLPAERVRGVKATPHGKRPAMKELSRAVDPKGRHYYWLHWADNGVASHAQDADLKWSARGYITVTPICLNLTNYAMLKRMEKLSL